MVHQFPVNYLEEAEVGPILGAPSQIICWRPVKVIVSWCLTQNRIWPHVPGSHIIWNQQKRIRTCKVRAWAKGRLEKISSFLGCLVPSSSSSASSIFTTSQKLLKFSFANDVMWKHVSVGVKHQPGAPCSRQHQLLPRPRVCRLPSSSSISDSQNSTQYRRSAPA